MFVPEAPALSTGIEAASGFRHHPAMGDQQLDLFSERFIPAEDHRPAASPSIVPGDLDDDALVAALPRATLADVMALTSEAVGPVADEDCAIVLGKIARARADLAEAALDALDNAAHPRAELIAQKIRDSR
jgi:hypothetical protein